MCPQYSLTFHASHEDEMRMLHCIYRQCYAHHRSLACHRIFDARLTRFSDIDNVDDDVSHSGLTHYRQYHRLPQSSHASPHARLSNVAHRLLAVRKAEF